MAAQIIGENLLADRDAFSLAHLAETVGVEGRLVGLDDEGRGVFIELVRMRPDPSLRRLNEDEGEGVVKLLVRAQPDEFTRAAFDVGFEMLREFVSSVRIETVCGDHQIIVVGILRRALYLGLKLQRHTELAGSLLQQQQKSLAPDAAETVAGGGDLLAAVMHGDVIPIGKMAADGFRACGIVGGKIVEGFIGKYHAPAECVVVAIALEYGDVGIGLAKLQRDRKVESRGTSSQTCDLHCRASFS